MNISRYSVILLYFFVFLILPNAFALKITEIMFDPPSNESYLEYVEVHNDESFAINLTEIYLCGDEILVGYINKSGSSTVTGVQIIMPGEYALITDGGSGSLVLDYFNVSEEAKIFHVNTSALCNAGLNNNNDTVVLSNESDVFDKAVYVVNETVKDNESLQLVNHTWMLCAATPGYENSCDVAEHTNPTECLLSIHVINLSCIFCRENEKLTYVIQVESDTTGVENLTVSYSASSIYNTSFFGRTTQFSFPLTKNKTKKSREWTLKDMGHEVVFLKAAITNSSCIPKNNSKMEDETVLYVLDSQEKESDPLGYVDILGLSKEKTKFGDVIKVKVKANRGNSSKYTVYVFIERASDGYDVSEKLAIYLHEKNKEYVVSVPVFVKPNCNHYFKDGSYAVVAESSWGERDTVPIYIEGMKKSVCSKTSTVSCSCPIVEPQKLHKPKDNVVKITDLIPCAVSGRNISFEVRISNPHNISAIAEVYSYAHVGKKLLSKHGWKPNVKFVELGAGQSRLITLSNEMKKVNTTTNCTLKVRVKILNKTYTAVSDLFILPVIWNENDSITNNDSMDATQKNSVQTEIDELTGRIINEGNKQGGVKNKISKLFRKLIYLIFS